MPKSFCGEIIFRTVKYAYDPLLSRQASAKKEYGKCSQSY